MVRKVLGHSLSFGFSSSWSRPERFLSKRIIIVLFFSSSEIITQPRIDQPLSLFHPFHLLSVIFLFSFIAFLSFIYFFPFLLFLFLQFSLISICLVYFYFLAFLFVV